MDKRSKKIVLLSHCILNQNSVVMPLARVRGPFKIIDLFVEKGIGIIQLPCPEFKFLGLSRKPLTKEEYECIEYRKICHDVFMPVLDDLKEYIKCGYEIVGLIGINQSPSCGVRGIKGIFMEEVFDILKKANIKIRSIDVLTDYEENSEIPKEILEFFN